MKDLHCRDQYISKSQGLKNVQGHSQVQDKWNKISRIWQHKKNYTNKFQIKHNIH